MNREDGCGYLWEEVENFIKNQEILCSESVYQSDHVIESAYAFIDRLCSIVGYYEEDEG